jgi:hypothetical protein
MLTRTINSPQLVSNKPPLVLGSLQLVPDSPQLEHSFTLKERGIPQLVLRSWYSIAGNHLVGGFPSDTHNCVDTPQRILPETLEKYKLKAKPRPIFQPWSLMIRRNGA